MWCCWLVWSLCKPSFSDMVLICSLVLDLFPSEIVFVQFAANSGWVSGSGTDSPSSSSWCCKGRWHSWPNTAHSPPPSQGARTIQFKEREEQAQGCSLSLFFWHGCFSMFQIHSGLELCSGFLLELSSQFRCAKSLSVVLFVILPFSLLSFSWLFCSFFYFLGMDTSANKENCEWLIYETSILFQHFAKCLMTDWAAHVIHHDKNRLADGMYHPWISSWSTAYLSTFVNCEPFCDQCAAPCETLSQNTMAESSHGFLQKLQKRPRYIVIVSMIILEVKCSASRSLLQSERMVILRFCKLLSELWMKT